MTTTNSRRAGTGTPTRIARPSAEAGRIIDVHSLTKRYGAHTAVDDVTFTVEPGSVTGFLGPNGAGKSTTMRMMVGLTPPYRWARHRPRRAVRRRFPTPVAHVGVLLDASAQHAGRTGREVLALDAAADGAAGDPGRRDARPGRPEPDRVDAAGWATTRSACASGSASRTPCSATRRC